jgi:hypothetical protein
MQPSGLGTAVSRVGWRDTIPYAIGRVLDRLSRGRVRLLRYYVVAQPVREPRGSRSTAAGHAFVRQVDREDPIVRQFPRPGAVIEQRFHNGSACFVVENGQRLAGFLWLARGAYDEDEFRCRYEFAQPDVTAWDFDVHVEPQYRMGRTFARLWDGANTYLAQRDIRWTLSRIATINRASLTAHMHLGARILHRATFLCIGAIQIAILSLPPFFHVSLSPASRPILHIGVPGDVDHD